MSENQITPEEKAELDEMVADFGNKVNKLLRDKRRSDFVAKLAVASSMVVTTAGALYLLHRIETHYSGE